MMFVAFLLIYLEPVIKQAVSCCNSATFALRNRPFHAIRQPIWQDC